MEVCSVVALQILACLLPFHTESEGRRSQAGRGSYLAASVPVG